jgi:S-(hydroxymethyl)glutathione dehydrogenase/alcohol dehydrogenase
MRFAAAVLNRVGEPLTVDTLDMAPLQAGDVLVRIRASGLCHTDLEAIQGSLPYPLPIVLGHEGAGVVEAVGKDVTRVAAATTSSARGTRTAAIATTASGTCRSCASRFAATSRRACFSTAPRA